MTIGAESESEWKRFARVLEDALVRRSVQEYLYAADRMFPGWVALCAEWHRAGVMLGRARLR